MPQPPPKIDPRTYRDLVAQTEQLAEHFSDWQAPPEGKTDAGRALIRIFGRLATMVSDRLNRSPEKHFLAFLNLIGAQQQPPRPARVPLTVYLVDNSPEDAFVPAYTQVAALPQSDKTQPDKTQSDDTEDVVFETEQDLVVMRSQLQSAIVYADQYYCDHLVATTYAHPFPIFNVEQDKAKTLYIAADQLTTHFGSQEIKVKLPTGINSDNWQWSYWQGESWQTLVEKNIEGNNRTFHTPADWKPPQIKTIEGVVAQWLRMSVPDSLPMLEDVQLVQSSFNMISPDQAFFNSDEIDLSKDFLPFGETPKISDTLYLASRNCFSLAGAMVTLTLKIHSGSKPSPDLSITWETWNGEFWTAVFHKASTDALTTNVWDQSIEFKLPPTVASTEVNGESNYWLRARLTAGNYGSEPPRFNTTTTIKPKPSKQTVDSTPTTTENLPEYTTESKLVQVEGTGFFPPRLESIQLSRDAVSIEPKKLLKALPLEAFVHKETDTPSLPGANPSDVKPALYLRFDRPFPNQSIALYLQIAPPSPGTLRNAKSVEEPAQVKWDYSNAVGWQPLSVIDGTQSLSQRGMVQFIGPSDLAPQTYFGQSGYWLRLRWQSGEFPIVPRLQQVLTNTVWATQTTTHQDEILGGASGDAFLALQTLHTPVLPGQHLVIREPERPGLDEQATLLQQEGQDAISVTTDESVQLDEIWVRWHQVSDFYGSGSRDRHYTLDRMTGEIRFGGEGQGMPPPQGRNNIRMARYQSGGGKSGNRGAETLIELKTTVPYVDRVTNHEPASGGADVESLVAVQESGPKWLRHRDRAVTWQDMEDLTYAASTDVARVKVITPQFDPLEDSHWLDLDASAEEQATFKERLSQVQNVVKVLIVPHSPAPQPTPSLALVEQVQRYLGDRISPTLTLQVTEPPWVRVTVTARVAPISLAAANGLTAVVSAALTTFLHPLTGGPKKQGWPFGRRPYESDLYALLERISGVSHVVDALQIDISPQPTGEERTRFLIYSGEHQITIAP